MTAQAMNEIIARYWRQMAGEFAALSVEASRSGDIETAIQCLERAHAAIGKGRALEDAVRE
jgi:hypothetical protein